MKGATTFDVWAGGSSTADQSHGTSTYPIRGLKGFPRVRIAAGKTRTVGFEIGPVQLRYWSAAARSYVQDATTVDVWIGGSSTADFGTTLNTTN